MKQPERIPKGALPQYPELKPIEDTPIGKMTGSKVGSRLLSDGHSQSLRSNVETGENQRETFADSDNLSSMDHEVGQWRSLKQTYKDTLLEISKRKPSSLRPGYLTILGGFCIHLVCGNQYLWVYTSDYAVTYFSYLGDQNATLYSAQFVFTVAFVMQSICLPMGPFLQKRIDPRLIMLIGSTIQLTSMLLASIQKNWLAFLFFYAICYPIGIGVVFCPVFMCGWEYFPGHKGKVNGTIVSGFGIGALFFSFIAKPIVNPSHLGKIQAPNGDLLYPEEVGANYPKMLRAMVGCWLPFCLVAMLTVSRNPIFVKYEKIKKEQMKTLGPEPSVLVPAADAALANTLIKQEFKNVIVFKRGYRTRRYFHMMSLLATGIFFGLYLTLSYKQMASDYLDEDQLFLSWCIATVFNALARPTWGALQDKFTFRRVYLTVMILQSLAASTIYFTRKNHALFTIWLSLGLFCMGAHFGMFPSTTMKIFGLFNGGLMFSTMFMGICISTVVTFLIFTYATPPVEVMMLVSACLSLLNIVNWYFFVDQRLILKRDMTYADLDSSEDLSQVSEKGI